MLEFLSYYSRIFSERKIHPSQSHSVKDDGTTVSTLTAPVGPDLVQWVLGRAEVVTIIKPESLKRKILAAIESFTQRHT